MTKKLRREQRADAAQQAGDGSAEPTIGPRNAGLTWQTAWDDYWFAPQSSAGLIMAQRIVSMIVAIWFLSMFGSLNFWWSDHGLNAATFASQLEAYTEGDFAARFRWSPLWLTDSAAVISAWCLVGLGLALASAFNYGGRIVRALLTLAVLLLTERMSWSVGLAESTMVAFTGYLALARLSDARDWSHRFAARLVHMHSWLLICAALANQVANDTWWQGETVWWLGSDRFSGLLEGRVLLVNALTHGITASTIMALVCLWPLALRPSRARLTCGLIAGSVLAMAYALLANQVLYGCLLLAGNIFVHLLFVRFDKKQRNQELA